MIGFLFIGIETTELNQRDLDRLQHPAVGGVLLLERNYESPTQIKQLCKNIHALKTPKLLIAVDHEGGRVQRFREGFSPIPSASSFIGEELLNQNVHPEIIERAKTAIAQYGKTAAKELIAAGIDINFAPCSDLHWGNSDVMSERCYHKNAAVVTELAGALLQAQTKQGLISTLKHFPGHGHASDDSHFRLPVDNRSWQMISNDISAFEPNLQHAPSLMMAHIRYPEIDHNIATFSKHWIQHILRQKLAYSGAIFSDDLCMLACNEIGGIFDRITLSLLAGNDFLIWGNELGELQDFLSQHTAADFEPHFHNQRNSYAQNLHDQAVHP